MDIRRITTVDDSVLWFTQRYLSKNKIIRQYPVSDERIHAMLQRMTQHPAYALWVAYDAMPQGDAPPLQMPVGFIAGQLQESLFHERIFAYDMGWYVMPQYEGQGIGRQLMDTYTDWAKANGASVAHFSVVFGDTAADQRSTEKLKTMGFEQWGTLTRKTLNNE